jgi:hypothetical protein
MPSPTKRTVQELMELAEAAIADGSYSDAEEYATRAQALVALVPKMSKGGTAGVGVEYSFEMIDSFIDRVSKLRVRSNASAYGAGKIVKIRPKAVGS